MKKLSMRLAVAVLVMLGGIMGLVFASTGASDVPEWLARKLEFEAKYEGIAKQWREKCAKEVAELERARAEAPKDEKGNPIMPGEYVPVGRKDALHPMGETYVVEKTVTVYLPSPKREKYVFTSEAHAPYDVLIAASDRQDNSIGVIFRLESTPDGFKSDEHRFPGKGPIVLESLEEDNNVVTFRWGSDGKGYFDLRDGTTSFKEYRSNP